MLTVYKYPVPIGDTVEIVLPEGAQILKVAVQMNESMMWALVNPHNKHVTRKFRFAGTGHHLDPSKNYSFIDTFMMNGGSLVFHIFEIID